MAILDHESFIRERAQIFDPNLDTNPGSPFDVQLIQPLMRRLGTDPFSVDTSTFIQTRMLQAFPDIANQEEDAVTDLLNKPVTLLFDPLVREIGRVRANQSFADPSQMTSEEAEALGANWFSLKKRGFYAKGIGRILFSQAQNATVSPANFFSSKGGLHFFPTETQSIRTEEMLINMSDGLYYFDINLIAEKPGTQYNIGPNELISVANIPSATRVYNPRRFTKGEKEENTQEYISRVQQERGERSLVTLRGAASKLVTGFPEISRLNVVGSNDPEMQRDIIKGGGLGPILAGGRLGIVLSDGEGQNLQRRFSSTEVDFIALAGAQGLTGGMVLTLFDAFGPTVPVQDLNVSRIVSSTEIDVSEQTMILGSSNLRWMLRRRELTLSDIPGGILFPNTPNGELVISSDSIHVGGMYDTFIRGSSTDEESFMVENITDDEPLLRGLTATVVASGPDKLFQLNSLIQNVNVAAGDATTRALDDAVRFGYTLQVQDAPEAGVYRILDWNFAGTGQVQVLTDPQPDSTTALNMRWRLFDVINVDLLNPRETRISGTDLSTLQNSDVLSVQAGTDFIALGVSQGDVVELLGGVSAGKYTILAAPLTPTTIRVDTVLSSTAGNISYVIYRANGDGALTPPFLRVTKVELLDTSGQPVGTTVPYARPVDVQTRAFQNPARGVKHDFRDTILGLVSAQANPSFNIAATDLVVVLGEDAPITLNLTSTGVVSLNTVIAELNAAFAANNIPQAVVPVGVDRFGIRPVGAQGFVAVIGGGARIALFGDTELRTTGDIRSVSVVGGWGGLSPAIDLSSGLDVVQVLDGNDVGFYPGPFTVNYANTAWPQAIASSALLVGKLDDNDVTPAKTFAPAKQRYVQIGSRSLGSARVYFLEPTSFEVDAATTFSMDLGTQGVISFVPDPTLEYQKLPALPANTPIQDGVTANNSNVFTSNSQDFILSGIRPGDRLEISNIPIEGTISLADPVANIAGKTLVFALSGGTDRTVIFLRDDASLSAVNGEVSRDGVVEQINSAAGEAIVELTSDNRLRFKTAKDLAIRGTNQGTANALILGQVQGTSSVLSFSTSEDQTNRSPFAGSYNIDEVTQTTLTLDITFALDASFPYSSPMNGQSFSIYRSGVQRISATQMSENEAEAGLYYFDVELVSQGAGDLWNVDAAQQLTIAGYRSDGYYITTDDQNLTFSEVERPKLVLSRSILEAGVDDDPVNATQLTGENIQITYERSQLVSDVQNFLSSETERVICANPLSRHLIPYFVRTDLEYQGTASEEDVKEGVEAYINNLAPVDTLDASDVQKVAIDKGATYVRNPLALVAIVHRTDRTVWVDRSDNQLAVDDRLSAFIPERIEVTRKTT